MQLMAILMQGLMGLANAKRCESSAGTTAVQNQRMEVLAKTAFAYPVLLWAPFSVDRVQNLLNRSCFVRTLSVGEGASFGHPLNNF